MAESRDLGGDRGGWAGCGRVGRGGVAVGVGGQGGLEDGQVEVVGGTGKHQLLTWASHPARQGCQQQIKRDLDVNDEGLHLNSTESPLVLGAAGHGSAAGPRRTRWPTVRAHLSLPWHRPRVFILLTT